MGFTFQDVRVLSRLREKETDIVSENRRLPVQKVRRLIHHDRKLSQLLQYLPIVDNKESSKLLHKSDSDF